MTTSRRERRQANLNRLLRPRHIAYIGGGQLEGAITASREAGFDGEIWVVNPVRDEIAGLACYACIEDLPCAPDAALIAMSAERSIESVAALAATDAGGAVCMAAGFAEIGGSGKSLQQKLINVAADLALVGPNCMGVFNLFDAASIWGAGGHFERPGARGAAIISQSGAFLYGITTVERGFPLGYAISTGNQAVVDVADCIESLLVDERVGAIGIYLEGLDDGAALGRACWHALEKGIPVIALKGGDTAAAETVAISHTSAMVVERDLWRAFCQRYAVVGVSTPKAMVEALKFLTIGGVPRGNRLSAITVSGGLNSLLVTAMPELGIELRQPSNANAEVMRAQLPDVAPVANPLDLNLPWASKTGMSLQDGAQIADCLEHLTDGAADMACFFLDVPRPDALGSDRDWYPAMEAMAKVSEAHGIPCAVAGVLPEGLVPDLRKHLIDLGIAPLLGFSDALEALAVATQIGVAQRSKTGLDPPGDLLTDTVNGAATRDSFMLDEAESKAALIEYGLKAPLFEVADARQVAAKALDIGYPVALKLISSEISHKAKMGGVALALGSEAALQRAVEQICQAGLRHNGEAVERFLVEAMIEAPCAEYIIGIKRQAALGLALLIGRGGVDTEKHGHHTTLLLPLVESDLPAAMQSIGLCADAPGYAGMLTAIRAVAAYAFARAASLQSLDVNPVIVDAAGSATAVDALIVMFEEN
ncbi:MAG: acetate--CoA ligase family protein [Gammaproteobacteria bacterium]|nr:acetate--CoA ligase family protein [Gammaproteobacteria bacterium]